jgi:hypothetical protein
VHGILPASGLATRMRGLPKFLLPCSDTYETLIERHVDHMLDSCEMVWIPTRPKLAHLLEDLDFTSDRVTITSLETGSMTETVLQTAKLSRAERFVIAMPDTYLLGELPFSYLANSKADLSLALWRIRDDQKGKLGQVLLDNPHEGNVVNARDKDIDCDYEHSWGAMGINRSILELADPEMPHVGYLIPPAFESGATVAGKVFEGSYYDCGTPREYLTMLEEVL